MTESMIERATAAVKAELDTFRDPVHYYVQEEAHVRWKKAGEVGPEPDFHSMDSYAIIVRAVMKAMREPTEAMVEAMLAAIGPQDPGAAGAAWYAMIDAALRETPTSTPLPAPHHS